MRYQSFTLLGCCVAPLSLEMDKKCFVCVGRYVLWVKKYDDSWLIQCDGSICASIEIYSFKGQFAAPLLTERSLGSICQNDFLIEEL